MQMFNNVFKNFIAYSVGPDFIKQKIYRNKKCSEKSKENDKLPIIKIKYILVVQIKSV